MVRLVKGAYWDTEIKRAQVLGVDDYPVYTRKPHTDVSYLGCARALLERTERIYPQFATHNAHTMAGVLHIAAIWDSTCRVRSSSSACTAWVKRYTMRCASEKARDAGSMRPLDRTATCWPTSCADCSRTAPTARS